MSHGGISQVIMYVEVQKILRSGDWLNLDYLSLALRSLIPMSLT